MISEQRNRELCSLDLVFFMIIRFCLFVVLAFFDFRYREVISSHSPRYSVRFGGSLRGKMQKTLGTTDSADLTDHVFDRRKESECLPQLAQIGTFFPVVLLCPKRNPIRCVAIDFCSGQAQVAVRPITSGAVDPCDPWSEVTSAFPRKVFGSADRRGAGRTWDRAGAAQE